MTEIRARGTPRKTRRDTQREETRKKLLDAARALFREHGYEDVAVTEIGRAAGVSYTLINAYFHGKQGLLYEIVRENNAPQWPVVEAIAAGNGPALTRLRDILRVAAEADARDPRLLGVMQSYCWIWPAEIEEDNRAARAHYKALLARIVEDGQRDGTIRATLDPEATARTIFSIYTWELRAVVFDTTDIEGALDAMRRQIDALILP